MKISIGKNENIADVIERIVTSEESEITLVIPKGSTLTSSPNNFRLLARESAVAKKELMIESVDDEVLTLARMSKLRSAHPLFEHRGTGGMFSDIVTGNEDALTRKHAPHGIKLSLPGEQRSQKHAEPIHIQIETRAPHADEASENETVATRPGKKRSNKRSRLTVILAALILLAVVLGVGMWFVARFFGRLEITIHLKKVSWEYQSMLTANTAVAKPDLSAKLLPLQVFSATKNLTQFFPATGKSGGAQKAKGTVTIYNAYGTQSQPLVATTRFMMPDGHIFRLDAGVTVPGAKMVGGKIMPSSIQASVTADQSGPDYNVPATPKLTIPGFKGTPKYDGFYGVFESPTTGGSLAGGKPIPTEDDIANAKIKITDILHATFQGNFLKTVPDGFIVVDGASSVTIPKLTIYSQTDETGKFSAFGEAQFIALGFRGEDVKAFVDAARDKDYSGMQFENEAITYTDARPDFVKKELKLNLHAQGTLRPAFNVDMLKLQLIEKSDAEVNALIQTIPGFLDAKVSYWPFWMRKTPADEKHIVVFAP